MLILDRELGFEAVRANVNQCANLRSSFGVLPLQNSHEFVIWQSHSLKDQEKKEELTFLKSKRGGSCHSLNVCKEKANFSFLHSAPFCLRASSRCSDNTQVTCLQSQKSLPLAFLPSPTAYLLWGKRFKCHDLLLTEWTAIKLNQQQNFTQPHAFPPCITTHNICWYPVWESCLCLAGK